MQHKLLTIRNMKLMMFLFVVIVMPNMGFCQNTPKKETKVDTGKQTNPTTVSSQKPVGTSMPVNVANPTTITYNDSALKSIQDTLNQISYHQTELKEFLGGESWKVNSWIGFWALIFGFIAAVAASLGYWYQKKSAKSLKQMENKRLPFMVFAKKIFENVLTLDIITDIESSGSAEQIAIRRIGYQVDKVIEGLQMPDDLIDIRCYEKFDDNSIYVAAIKLKLSWRAYNKNVNELSECYASGKFETIEKKYNRLRYRTVSLLQELFDFENLILKIPKEEKSPVDFVYTEYYRLDGDTKEKIPSKVPNKTIDAKKMFLFQLLVDSMRELEHAKIRANRDLVIINPSLNGKLWVSDSELFKYDIDSFEFDLDFPLPEIIYKLNQTKSTQEDGFVKRMVKRTVIKWMVNKKVQKLPQTALDLYEIISKDYLSFPNPYSDIVPYPSQCSFGKAFVGAWGEYALKMKSCISQKNHLLLRMVYNMEIGIRREKMIVDSKFHEDEALYYSNELVRYNSFPYFFNTNAENGVTLRELIYAIVAEQNGFIDAGELNINTIDDYSPIKSVYFVPVLERMGVMRNGTVAIKTIEEVFEIMKQYSEEMLNCGLENVELVEFIKDLFNNSTEKKKE